jgi:copper chaperone CopZ
MSNTVTLDLTGLTCQACVRRVETALAPLADSVTVTVNSAQIYGANVAPQVLLDAVASAGHYAATIVGTQISGSAAPPVKFTNSVAIPAAQIATIDAPVGPGSFTTYFPLILLSAYLVLVPALAQSGAGAFDGDKWMRHFMAAFFLAFSFFKLLNLRAFADAYAGYDLIAAKWRGWGFVYPFVELALGIAYLVGWNRLLTNAVTLVVMSVSLIGVIRAVLSKQTIRCACLGAVFNLPMSTVTIIEDGLMVAMAAWMLYAL